MNIHIGLNKSKCMITGYKPINCINDPAWYMNGQPMSVVDNVDILGVNFSSNVRYDKHVIILEFRNANAVCIL